MIEWRPIPNHENYEASNTGEIRRVRNERIVSQRKKEELLGYKVICLYTNKKKYTKNVARLIWNAFNDCECEHTIDHIDRDASNNNIENLRCITHSENSRNRNIYSRDSNKYNLTDEIKREIITKYKSGEMSTWDIIHKYKIPSNYIHMVLKRGSWDKLINEPDNVQQSTEDSK